MKVNDKADWYKFMCQQRWLDRLDQEFHGHYLGWFREGPGPWDQAGTYGSKMRDRQVGRNALVGVSSKNRPVIDLTFKVVPGAFENRRGRKSVCSATSRPAPTFHFMAN